MMTLIRRIVVFGVLAFIAVALLIGNGYVSNPIGLWEISKHRPRAEAQLARLENVARAAATAKLPSEPWNASSIASRTGVMPSDDTVLAVHLEHLLDLGTRPSMGRVWFCEALPVSQAAAFVRTGRWPGGEPLSLLDMGEVVRDKFEALDRVRHVIVIRPVSYSPPEDKGIRFVTGYYTGEALAFDAANARVLGGFTFDARNSSSVEGRGSLQSILVRNLSKNASAAFHDQLKTRVPALTPEGLGCS